MMETGLWDKSSRRCQCIPVKISYSCGPRDGGGLGVAHISRSPDPRGKLRLWR